MIHPDTPDAPWGTVETRFDPIHSAARMRDVSAVRKELDAGVDVDILHGRAANGDGGNTALWFAAQGPAPFPGDAASPADERVKRLSGRPALGPGPPGRKSQ